MTIIGTKTYAKHPFRFQQDIFQAVYLFHGLPFSDLSSPPSRRDKEAPGDSASPVICSPGVRDHVSMTTHCYVSRFRASNLILASEKME